MKLREHAKLALQGTAFVVGLGFMLVAPILAWAYLWWPYALIATIVWIWLLLFLASWVETVL